MMRYFHTLRHLRIRQVVYRVWYAVRGRVAPLRRQTGRDCHVVSMSSITTTFPNRRGLFFAPRRFSFLNVEHAFSGAVEWDIPTYGKLWTYNLNYFDFLLEENLSQSDGLALMDDFMASIGQLKNANEPYPISLRVFNWVKFLQLHEVPNPVYARFAASDLDLLSRQPEYHLMGNHLLENGFALYFGGMMLGLDTFAGQGRRLLRTELEEQILSDGGHFERSPMYHLILLERLLDCLNVGIQREPDEAFLGFLKRKAVLMVRWISTFSFSNGSYAHVNDSTDGVARSVDELMTYAQKLGIDPKPWNRMKESGYRKLSNARFELLVDVGPIGPDYIPGHAHSDNLSFVLQHRGRPVIVDTGISTYEANDIRSGERSTASHNTVMIAGQEQSEIWGAFRVARRARTEVLYDTGDSIKARHDGYQRIGAVHTRDFLMSEDRIVISDFVTGSTENVAYVHLHPEIESLALPDGSWQVGDLAVSFEGQSTVEMVPFDFAVGFNKRVPSQKLKVSFREQLTTIIHENTVSDR